MNTTPSAVDYLKYCTAESKSRLDYVIDRLGQVDADYPLTDDEIEVLQTFLEGVQRTVVESTAAFCRDGNDFEHYSDGRPVRTRLEVEKGVIFEHRWHPQPDHRDNQAREVYTARGRDGRRRTVFVAEPGVLDSINHGPALRLIEGDGSEQ